MAVFARVMTSSHADIFPLPKLGRDRIQIYSVFFVNSMFSECLIEKCTFFFQSNFFLFAMYLNFIALYLVSKIWSKENKLDRNKFYSNLLNLFVK